MSVITHLPRIRKMMSSSPSVACPDMSFKNVFWNNLHIASPVLFVEVPWPSGPAVLERSLSLIQVLFCLLFYFCKRPVCLCGSRNMNRSNKALSLDTHVLFVKDNFRSSKVWLVISLKSVIVSSRCWVFKGRMHPYSL